MKTASFFTYTGPGRVSIARYAPRNTPAGFKVYSALKPGEWFNSVGPNEYVERYFHEVLEPLDPKQVWDELHEKAGGAEPVCLCWEKLGPDEIGTPLGGPFNARNWCHRLLVAQWLGEALSVEIPEIGPGLASEKWRVPCEL